MRQWKTLAVIPALALTVTNCSAVECPYAAHRSLEVTPEQKFYAKLDCSIALNGNFLARDWSLYIADAPVTDAQNQVSSQLTLRNGTKGVRVVEAGPAHRSVLTGQAVTMEESDYSLKGEYWAILYKRHISQKPGKVPPLSSEEQALYLRESESYDFNQPVFVQWLQTSGLRRRNDESVLQFAWRAYDFLRTNYSYQYTAKQQRNVSYLCTQRVADCGGCSFLLVSILRSNRIQARATAGRWAKSSTKPEESGSGELGTFHVKSEFYAPGIGWVPVDVSKALGCSAEDAPRFFGHDQGNFFVMHIDPDFKVQTALFGEKRFTLLQSPAFWVKGKGSFQGSTSKIFWSAINQRI